MKKIAVVFIFAAVFLCPGCKKEEPSPKQKDGSAMDVEREKFYKETQTHLDDLNRQIAELKQQSKQVSQDQKSHYREAIDDLEKKEIDLRENLEQIKTAGKEAWEDLKPRLRSALDDLTQGLGNAISEFKFSKPRPAE